MTLSPGHFRPPSSAASGLFCDSDNPAELYAMAIISLPCVLEQVVALVGPSGGGKSSIVKLIERFYLPSAGRILLDGRDVGLYNPSWLRRRVALVSQEPVLYARR